MVAVKEDAVFCTWNERAMRQSDLYHRLICKHAPQCCNELDISEWAPQLSAKSVKAELNRIDVASAKKIYGGKPSLLRCVNRPLCRSF